MDTPRKTKGGDWYEGTGRNSDWNRSKNNKDKISLLKKKLAKIDKQSLTRRKGRADMIRVALVGYTNAGKSTLMNKLSKSEIFAENKLFATLDTTVRKVVLKNLPFLLSDTVGFIRKLPHQLVESFKSTLDEVRESDLLLHVVDISNPNFEEQIEIVNTTISDIGAQSKPQLIIFNKIDAYIYEIKEEDDLTPIKKENLSLNDLKLTWMSKLNIDSIFISALDKINFDELRDILYERVKAMHVKRYPYNNFLY